MSVAARAMLKISNQVIIPDSELEIQAIRAQGAGGQNVNKVSTAVHLRYDIKSSSIPDFYKERLLNSKDQRISKDGVIIIKAQSYRSQQKNKEDALRRLKILIKRVSIERKKRKATKPTPGSREKRLEAKAKRGRLKTLRGRVDSEKI